MFRSRRRGAASISVACERPTKAPAAGLLTSDATSREAKSGLRPASSVPAANATPPPVMSARLRHTSPRMPSKGSMKWLRSAGTLRRRPTCV